MEFFRGIGRWILIIRHWASVSCSGHENTARSNGTRYELPQFVNPNPHLRAKQSDCSSRRR